MSAISIELSVFMLMGQGLAQGALPKGMLAAAKPSRGRQMVSANTTMKLTTRFMRISMHCGENSRKLKLAALILLSCFYRRVAKMFRFSPKQNYGFPRLYLRIK